MDFSESSDLRFLDFAPIGPEEDTMEWAVEPEAPIIAKQNRKIVTCQQTFVLTWLNNPKASQRKFTCHSMCRS